MVRASLAVFLALWTPVQAAEPAFDALAHTFKEYAGPVDAVAAGAPEPEAPAGERLAQVSADLALMAEGFELFRAPAHAEAALANLPDYVIPELRPFFVDRDAALSTIYRTLAVTDYTWASRFPESGCEPREKRAALLSAEDRLFADEKGALSPWLARLLGPAAVGRSAAEALDRASAKTALSAGDYERLRAKAAKVGAALRSDKAVGRDRAKLYCLRAEIYESLAAAHRAEGAPIAASRTTGSVADSVVALAWAGEGKAPRVVGAGVLVETPAGPRLLSASRLKPDEDRVLTAITRGGAASYPVAVEHVSGEILVARVPGFTAPALRLASGKAASGDFFRALGHLSSAGLWSQTQGLVTETREGAFASDALVSPDLIGSPLLDDAGEVVGLVVLTPDGAPVALRAETLRAAVAGAASAAIDFPPVGPTGTASLLTTALPITGDLPGPGGMAVEAGLPSVSGGVNWEGGGGLGNWRPRSSAGPPRGYSRYSSGSSSSYSSSASAGAEIGRELGKALAPLVEALIFKGIPALFRGIGSLFKSNPSATPKARIIVEKKKEEPKPTPAPKPKPELKVRLAAAQDQYGKYVFTATLTSTDPEQLPVGGHELTFTVNGTTSAITRTNAAGIAILYVDNPPPNVAAHKDLDEESAKHPWLIATGRTLGENVCYAALGATVFTLEVTVVLVATATGGPAGAATATICVKANPAIIAGALAVCALAKGAEVAANKPPIKQPAPVAPPIVKTERDRVEAAADKHHDSLDAETREQANSEGQSTPGDPNDPDNEEKELDQIGKNIRSDLKKPSANDSELKKVIDDLFQPTDRYPGGTAGALRREAITKAQTGNRWHAQKAQDNINRLNRLLRTRKMSDVDRATAEAMKADLQHAVDAWARSALP